MAFGRKNAFRRRVEQANSPAEAHAWLAVEREARENDEELADHARIRVVATINAMANIALSAGALASYFAYAQIDRFSGLRAGRSCLDGAV